MSKNFQSTDSEFGEESAQGSAVQTSSLPDVSSRRRMLISSLGKGSAAVAAASIPMHTLAGQSTRCKTDGSKPVRACISGMQSAVGSMAASWPISQGRNCSYYLDKTKWPSQSDCTKKFSTLFPGATTTNASMTCFDIVKTKSTSKECRWVLAYLNAQTCVGYYYPYDVSEVKSLYTGGVGKPTKDVCETFFGTYMETRST